MFGRIRNTWDIMGASWELLKRDKEMLLYALFSSIGCLAVLIAFAVPLWSADVISSLDGQVTPAEQVAYVAVLFLFYFCNYFVITFFNSAIVANAVTRMGGGDPTFQSGLQAAFERIHLIAAWSLLSATVGMVLRLVEERSEALGRIVAGIVGAIWTLATFLVVPILVVEKKGPIDALRKSGSLLKKTWGEQIVSDFSFGGIFFLLGLPAMGLIVLGVVAGSMGVLIACVVLAVLYWMALGLVQATLYAIFQAAMYVYVEVGHVPAGFDGQLLDNAVRRK